MRRGGHDIRTVLARLPKTEAAIRYAEKVHAGQVRRADGAPFILHPLEVAGLLYGARATKWSPRASCTTCSKRPTPTPPN